MTGSEFQSIVDAALRTMDDIASAAKQSGQPNSPGWGSALPWSTGRRLDNAQKALDTGRYSKAITILNRVDPSNVEARSAVRLLRLMFALEGRLQRRDLLAGGKVLLDDIAEAFGVPSPAMAAHWEGIFELDKHELEQSAVCRWLLSSGCSAQTARIRNRLLDVARTVSPRFPKHTHLKLLWARAEDAFGSVDRCVEIYSSMLDGGPVQAAYSLASHYIDMRRSFDARAVCETALKHHPGDSRLTGRLIAALVNLNDLESAEVLAKRALKEQPNNGFAVQEIFRIDQKRGKLADTRDLIERQLGRPETARSVLPILPLYLVQMGDRDGALAILRKGFACDVPEIVGVEFADRMFAMVERPDQEMCRNYASLVSRRDRSRGLTFALISEAMSQLISSLPEPHLVNKVGNRIASAVGDENRDETLKLLMRLFIRPFGIGRLAHPKEVAGAWLDPEARRLLAECENDDRGVLIFGTHLAAANLAFRAIASEVSGPLHLFSNASYDTVVAWRNRDVWDDRHKVMMRAQFGAARILYRITKALRRGETAYIVNDHHETDADTSLQFWSQSFRAIPTAPTGVAIETGSLCLFFAQELHADGTFRVTLRRLETPQQPGDDDQASNLPNKVESRLLLQRYTAAVRGELKTLEELAYKEPMTKNFVAMNPDLVSLDRFLDKIPDARTSCLLPIYAPDFHSQQTAIVDDTGDYTYPDLRDRSLRAASLFLALRGRVMADNAQPKLRDYPRVAVCMRPGFSLLSLIMGGLAAGVLIVSLSPAWKTQTLQEQLEELNPDLVVLGADIAADLFENGLNTSNVLLVDHRDDGDGLDVLLDDLEPARKLPAYDPNRPALVQFTSGSGGEPKAVVHDHRHLAVYPCAFDQFAQCSPEDRVLYPSSWAHAGITFVLHLFRSGASLHQLSARDLASPGRVAKVISERRITVLSIAASYLNFLLRFSKLSEQTAPDLRHCDFWGEVAPPGMTRILFERFPQTVCRNRYGASEIGCLSWQDVRNIPASPEEPDVLPIGTPYEGALVAIVDAHPETGEGRLQVRAPSVMMGYWREIADRPIHEFGAELRSFVVNDRCRYDASGRLVIVGRTDNLIKVNGNLVSLDKVEAVLGTHQDIAEAVAIEGHNQTGSAVVIAAVRLMHGSNCDVDTLIRFCRDTLPGYAVPQKLVIFDEIPRVGAGKVDRKSVAELLGAGPRCNVGGGEVKPDP